MAEPHATSPPDLKYRLLLGISQEISRTFDLEAVLSHLLESVRSVIMYDAAGIFVLNRHVPLSREPGRLLIQGMATVGFDATRPEDDPMLSSGKGIVGHVIRSGEAIITPDVRLDARYIAGRRETLSEIAVPIVSNDQIIGALNLESDRLDAFSPADSELLEFFASAAAISIEKAILHHEVLEKQRMEDQLRIARDVQASLLPASSPAAPGYDMAGINLPTWEIGGDYYDYIPLTGGRVGLVVADVAGKGVPAALIMASFRAALRAVLRNEGELRSVIEDVNQVLVESTDASGFVTAVYGVLDPGADSFTYVNCGHNPPLLLRSDGGRKALEEGGPALGVFRDCRFESETITLRQDDALAFYTDGVIELADQNDAQFGVGRLEQVLRSCAHLPAQEMIRTVIGATRGFAGTDAYDDDFTLVVVKRIAPVRRKPDDRLTALAG